MKWKLIVFDWDGTLLDNAKDAYGGGCYIFNHYNIKPPPAPVFWENITTEFLPFYHQHGIPPDATRDILNDLWTTYWTEKKKELSLRIGAREVLNYCRQQGIGVAIVSGSTMHAIKEGLDQLSVGDLVQHIEASARGKTGELKKVLDIFSVEAIEAMYVDDTYEGVQAARMVGVTAVGIAGGFNSKERIVEANPNYLIFSLDQLFALGI